MRVKICGVTTMRDARAAERAGADAIGVVVCSDSPRNVPVSRAREIFESLSPLTEKVCVTDTTSESDIRLILSLNATSIQLHSEVKVPSSPRIRVIRAVGPGSDLNITCDAIIVDGSRGKGIGYDQGFVRTVMNGAAVPVILAGGLTPDNVGQAITEFSPYAVDVSSGVEKSPGIKDHTQIKAFVRVCRETAI
jgi:phosphoribosylanthranilate isomerase